MVLFNVTRLYSTECIVIKLLTNLLFCLKTFCLSDSQAERRRKLGLPAEVPSASKPSAAPPVEEKKVFS
jgi:hypothetical protein